jgi:hypothetical protein
MQLKIVKQQKKVTLQIKIVAWGRVKAEQQESSSEQKLLTVIWLQKQLQRWKTTTCAGNTMGAKVECWGERLTCEKKSQLFLKKILV